MNYLILQHPGHNRVYYLSATKMALAELKIASQRLSVAVLGVDIKEIEGVSYLAVDAEKDLAKEDIDILSRLSFVFALFSLEKIEGKLYLNPIRKVNYEYIDSKISSVLKYQGKTNELFTKMMLNVALLSSDFSYDEHLKMMDPVAGRGTTLFEASVYGYDAYGVEVESKSVHDTSIFFKKYLETERLKHTLGQRQVSGTNKNNAVILKEFKYAKTAQAFKSKENRLTLGLVEGSSQFASKYFKNNTFHLIVGDLPYGIVHGNTTKKKAGSITRNPSELLELCLADWYKVLKPGGVVVVAWNSFLVSRHKLSQVFEEFGFKVLSDAPYDEFEHMVDKSIKRDIVVAKKM